jgi:hypothetical protein
MPEETKKQYIGPNEIFGLEKTGKTTPKGIEIVKVNYKDGMFPEEFPITTFERIVSVTPQDYNYIREMKHKQLINDLTATIMENDIKLEDLTYVCKTVADKIQDSYERACNFLLTKNDKTWIPGVSFLSGRSVLEMEAILKTIGEDGKPKS